MAEDDIIVVEDKTIDPIKRHAITHSRWALLLSVIIVGAFACFSASVLLHAYFTGTEVPAWAAATQSSVMTAALALIFKDRLTGSKD